MSGETPSGRWRRIESLLESALAHDAAARDRYLDAACGDDPELRREVASLIDAHERSGPLDRLAADVAPLAARVQDAADPLAGRTIGRFRIVAPVGGGGMGVVYRAFDSRLDRHVALKFLRPLLGADDSAAERFRLEARAVAALEHPNICTIHEIGETEDGRLFLAMPLYDGEVLQRRVARGPLPVGEAVGIAVQVARGLAKAHGRGIIHRDIKPSNVLVTADGVVKILDFGIAKLSDVTLTGSAAGPLGTVAYMSPEQALGQRVDPRTDVWSLGVVLYEMLAGRRPFAGEHSSVVLDAITHREPEPVERVRPEVPPALAAVVARALAKAPDARIPTAQAFAQELLALGLAEGVSGELTPSSGAGREAQPPRRARAARTAAAAVAVLVLAAGAWFAMGRRRAPEASSATPTTVAVLPFADRSQGRDQEYFSDGITEELIATLARVEGLRVASRTSAFAFRDRGLDVREVGRQLGVSRVLEGSVRRDGERLRITAQLVNVEDGYPVWSETYDRSAADAFAVQGEIARAIANVMRVRLVGAAADTSGVSGPDAEAYDLYLKGRYAWYRRTEEGLRTAVSYFERAAARAPDYARAHAGLADAYAVAGFYDYIPPREAFPKAEAAARRAVALDPTLAAPRATLGYVALYHGWDFARGEEEFRRAIALEPNYSTAHQWYANLLLAAGRLDDAEREMRLAEEIDPLSLIAKAALCWVLVHKGDAPAALAQCRATLELDPRYAVATLWAGAALVELDSLPAAIAMHRRGVEVTDSSAIHVAALARVLALGGERAESESLLRGLESRGGRGAYVPSYELAKVHEALGARDRAIASLERAYAERSHSMVFLRVDPQLAPLRGDPRFDRLVGRVFGP